MNEVYMNLENGNLSISTCRNEGAHTDAVDLLDCFKRDNKRRFSLGETVEDFPTLTASLEDIVKFVMDTQVYEGKSELTYITRCEMGISEQTHSEQEIEDIESAIGDIYAEWEE